MDYEIFHVREDGTLEDKPCGLLTVAVDCFVFETDNDDIADMLFDVKDRGALPNFEVLEPNEYEGVIGDIVQEILPADDRFIPALEEFIGNCRFIEKSE